MSDPECPSKKKKTAADEPSFFQTFGDFASESGVLPAATTRRVGCSQLQLHRQIVHLQLVVVVAYVSVTMFIGWKHCRSTGQLHGRCAFYRLHSKWLPRLVHAFGPRVAFDATEPVGRRTFGTQQSINKNGLLL